MSIVKVVRNILNPLNIDLVKYPNEDLRRRLKMIEHFNINKILDVGANIGQYASLLRKLGYSGEILSFEPLSGAYKVLSKRSKRDRKWEIYNFGLGDVETTHTMNVSENSYSSSILDMTQTHRDAAPDSRYIESETIEIKKLNSIFDEVVGPGDNVFLKLDVQGFEKKVLDGADEVLSKIKGIQLETSLIELYKDELLFLDIVKLLSDHGFKLYGLENGFYNKKTGQLLQVDGIFFNE